MPSNQTPNYKLSQWSKSDRIQMEDFNADNAKLDAALKSEADARCTADSAINTQLARKGNCRIWTTTYTGTDTYGSDNPTTFTFPGKPLLVFVSNLQSSHCLVLVQGSSRCMAISEATSRYCSATWSGNSVSLIGSRQSSEQMNFNCLYRVVALIAADE